MVCTGGELRGFFRLAQKRRTWHSRQVKRGSAERLGDYGGEILEEWLVWRVILAKRATLTELETTYTLLDLLKLNIALDIEQEMERQSVEEARLKTGGKL